MSMEINMNRAYIGLGAHKLVCNAFYCLKGYEHNVEY